MSIDQSTEIFLDVPGWPGYRVSNFGRVLSCRPRNGQGGLLDEWHELKLVLILKYFHVGLCRGYGERKLRKVHQLVLEAFVGPRPPGMVCRHLDGNHKNNVLENLAWGTRRQNYDDSMRHGALATGERNGRASLNEPIVRLILRLHRDGMTPTRIAKEIGISHGAAKAVTNKRTWKNVTI